MPWQFAFNGLVNGTLIALLALGLSIIQNTTRVFHIAHGAVYTLAGYVYFVLAVDAGAGSVWSGLGAVAAAAAVGVVMEVAIYAPLSRRDGSSLTPLLASLGLYTVIIHTITVAYGNQVNDIPASIGSPIVAGPLMVTLRQVEQCAVATAVIGVLLLWLRISRLGQTIRAVSDSEILAEAMAINATGVRLAALAIGSGLAGLAAALQTADTGISPHVGMQALLNAAVACLLAGRGYVGVLLGALLLGIVQGLAFWLATASGSLGLSSGSVTGITFLILFVALLVRPEGLLGPPFREEERT